MNRLNVLVFDDNEHNRNAAAAQLEDHHDLTIVGTYDEAQRLLTPSVDWDEFFRLKAMIPEGCEDWRRLEAEAKERATRYPHFDVFLSDLLVPASRQALTPQSMHFAGQEMPIGIFAALMAGTRSKIRYAAVFTDSNRHAHPASTCFDGINEDENNPLRFRVNDCTMIVCNTREWVRDFSAGDLATAVEDPRGRTDVVRAKDWRMLLEYLVAPE